MPLSASDDDFSFAKSREDVMRRTFKIAGFFAVGLFLCISVAVPLAVGIRPIVGARARALTERRFDATPARLERGRYLITAVNGCFSCHAEVGWEASGFPVKAGTEGSGR